MESEETSKQNLLRELKRVGIISDEQYSPKDISMKLGFSIGCIESNLGKRNISYEQVREFLGKIPGEERPYTWWEKKSIHERLKRQD